MQNTNLGGSKQCTARPVKKEKRRGRIQGWTRTRRMVNLSRDRDALVAVDVFIGQGRAVGNAKS